MQGHKSIHHRVSYSWWRNGLVCLLLFFLLWEWLRPLIEMSHVTNLHIHEPFLIAIAGFVLLDYLRVPIWLGWMLKLVICLCIVSYFFHQSFPIELNWWRDYATISLRDGFNVLQGHFFQISPENQTLFFLYGWSFMISAVQSLLMYRQSAYGFIIATIAYLLILQLWAGVDTTFGIVRTLGISLMLISLLKLPQLERLYGRSMKSTVQPILWTTLSVVMVVLTLSTGIYFSQSKAQEIEPLDWKQLMNFDMLAAMNMESFSVGQQARSGYGEDDTRLGGRLALDEEVVFTARTEQLTYWRGESKDYYTGKGWEQTRNFANIGFNELSDIQDDEYQFRQEVLMRDDRAGHVIFAGGAVVGFDGLMAADGALYESDRVMINSQSGKYTFQEEAPVTFYQMNLRRDDRLDSRMIVPAWNDHSRTLMQSYVQLPDELPERVRLLAIEIAGDARTTYEQAELIEQYLQQNYVYDLAKPAFPERDEDFVDHFLFGQKLGYCDHFSTAMVVLLRSLDIPARWVKGYAPGDAMTSEAGYTVTVKNLHAHSWVEAYMPEVGWVSFEPTPSFGEVTMVAAISSTIDHETEAMNSSSMMEKLSEIRWNWVAGVLVGAVAVMASVLLMVRAWRQLRKRGHRWNRNNRADQMFDHFHRYWNKIFRRYGPLQPSQTVREYVESLKMPDVPKKQELIKFAMMYETVRYNEEHRQWISKQAIDQAWKRIGM